jgi:DNA-binding response OmpR family regulator
LFVTESRRAGDRAVVLVSDDRVVDARQFLLLVDPAGPTRLAPVLERCGFSVIWSSGAEAALFELGEHDFGAVVVALPLSGLGVAGLCQEVRRRGHIPVLVVTSDDDADWLDALAAGADDHVNIPCDERELTARLAALIRRVRGPLSPRRVVRVGAMVVHLGHGVVTVAPSLGLTPVQMTLLGYLAGQRGVVISETVLADGVRAAHGPRLHGELDAELRGLQAAVATASGVDWAIEQLDGIGWRLGVVDDA